MTRTWRRAIVAALFISTGASFSGKIASVSINSDGSIATLEDGTKVAVGPGLTLS